MNCKELDICLIMGLYPKANVAEIEDNSIYGIQNAANVFQWNIVDGIISNDITNINIINSMYIGSFPKKYKKLVIPSYEFDIQNGLFGKNVGFLNIPVIKEGIRFLSMKKNLKKWALNPGKNKLAIAYAATYPMTKALSYLKRINPEIKTCLVVPDLPIYMNLSQSKTSILHQIKDKIVEAEILKADSYVLLTEQMKDVIEGARKKPVAIVEGMVSIQGSAIENTMQNKKNDYKYFLYSGTLNFQYGIMDLVDSYEAAKTGDVHLVICGEGEASDEIREHVKKNNKIHFLGCCSHKKVLELQRNAFALVNPRRNEGEYTKYSFPSKIMEYMYSGRPTVAYFLAGMPNEYRRYLICIEDGEDGIKNALEYIAQKDEAFCDSFGKAARNFVIKQKNCKEQMKKVLGMFNGGVV